MRTASSSQGWYAVSMPKQHTVPAPELLTLWPCRSCRPRLFSALWERKTLFKQRQLYSSIGTRSEATTRAITSTSHDLPACDASRRPGKHVPACTLTAAATNIVPTSTGTMHCSGLCDRTSQSKRNQSRQDITSSRCDIQVSPPPLCAGCAL